MTIWKAEGTKDVARILVAEDDPHAREMIVRICEFQGHRVEEARDGVRARELYERLKPDLIITDLAMPLGSGQQFIQSVHDLTGDETPPIIVVTGYAAALTAEEREAMSAFTIIEKPIDVAPMLEALRKVLGD